MQKTLESRQSEKGKVESLREQEVLGRVHGGEGSGAGEGGVYGEDY